jgi:hypothetical protein
LENWPVLLYQFNATDWPVGCPTQQSALESDCDGYARTLLQSAFLSSLLPQAEGVEEENGFAVADALGDAPEDSSQVLELLVLHLLQKEAKKVVFEVFLFDIGRSEVKNISGRFLVAALWFLDHLPSNQCVLIVAQVIVEFQQKTLIFIHVPDKTFFNLFTISLIFLRQFVKYGMILLIYFSF